MKLIFEFEFNFKSNLKINFSLERRIQDFIGIFRPQYFGPRSANFIKNK